MMEKNSGVMSHDPLADIDVGDVPAAASPVPVTGAEDDTVADRPPEEAVAEDIPPREDDSSHQERVIVLSESLTIADVAELHKEFSVIFDTPGQIRLDAGPVEQIDGAGIQLLSALMKEAVERQVEIGWVGVSENLKSAAAQLGVAELLRLDSAA